MSVEREVMTSPVTKLATEVLELSEKATPGPWQPYLSRIVKDGVDSDSGFICCSVIEDKKQDSVNMPLIAHYRDSAPKLAKIVLLYEAALIAILGTDSDRDYGGLTPQMMLTGLRHDEHEVRHALAEAQKILEEK